MAKLPRSAHEYISISYLVTVSKSKGCRNNPHGNDHCSQTATLGQLTNILVFLTWQHNINHKFIIVFDPCQQLKRWGHVELMVQGIDTVAFMSQLFDAQQFCSNKGWCKNTVCVSMYPLSHVSIVSVHLFISHSVNAACFSNYDDTPKPWSAHQTLSCKEESLMAIIIL